MLIRGLVLFPAASGCYIRSTGASCPTVNATRSSSLGSVTVSGPTAVGATTMTSTTMTLPGAVSPWTVGHVSRFPGCMAAMCVDVGVFSATGNASRSASVGRRSVSGHATSGTSPPTMTTGTFPGAVSPKSVGSVSPLSGKVTALSDHALWVGE